MAKFSDFSISAASDEYREGNFPGHGRRRAAALHGVERLLDGRGPAERLLEGDVSLPGLAKEEKERSFDFRTRLRRKRDRGWSPVLSAAILKSLAHVGFC